MTFHHPIIKLAIALAIILSSCTKERLAEVNTDPNRPGSVPTPSLILSAQKQLVDNIRSESFSLKGTMLFAQYYSQNIYTDQSRYDIPRSVADSYWAAGYKTLNNLNEIITLNSDPKTKAIAEAGTAGTNENQIAISRVLKAVIFHSLTDAFGNVPYQSYGNQEPGFEALQQNPDNYTPAYTEQEDIYLDLLTELKQAADTLWKYKTGNTFGSSDIIYKGDNEKWARFANSLRLRLAMRIKSKLPAVSEAHFSNALQQGVFTDNNHNAIFKYSSAAPNEAPLFRATVTANRKDYAVSHILVNALNGKLGPFVTADPRLRIFALPNQDNQYVGQPYGLPLEAAGINGPTEISLPGSVINTADFGEMLMEYAEVAFLISEYQDWNNSEYKKGVKASLLRWGIAEAVAENYTEQLAEANKERVLTQKYFALYTQGLEAWSEIRRTGFPTFLVKPGDLVWARTTSSGVLNYVFEPVFGKGIPKRLFYPEKEQSVNKANYQKSLSQQGDDVITTSLWWNQ